MATELETGHSLTAAGGGTPACNKSLWPRVRRKGGRLVMALGLLAAALLVAGAAYQFAATLLDAQRYPAPGAMVDVGGHRLHLYCTGEGPQTVILEAGLGGGVPDWGAVQPEVAKFARVCSYDHAGAGWSEAGPGPRDSGQVIRELHTLLSNAGLKPPYILVGHSLGGLSVQLYASRYPEEVAGVVLVDSSQEGQASMKELPNPPPYYALLIKAVAPFGVGRVLLKFNQPSENIPAALAAERAAIYSHTGHLFSVADEFLGLPESMRQARESPMQFGAKPLVVLTHGELQPASTPGEAERADAAWRELQADLAGRSSDGRHVIAEGSGHYIQFDRPDLVVDSIRRVADAAGS